MLLTDTPPTPAAGPGPSTNPDRAALSRQRAQHDAQLVRRFKNHEAPAFVEIVERHRDNIFAVAFGVLRNHADAEEIAQDTFIRAHRALVDFRGEASLATWLHCIALNLARNRYWYFFRRRRHATLSLNCPLGENSDSSFTDLVASEETGPVRAVMAAEFSDLIASCTEKLEPKSREILGLRNGQNLTYEEIAARLGIRLGTVKSRLGRARESLRRRLVQACPDFGPDAMPSAWFDPARSSGALACA